MDHDVSVYSCQLIKIPTVNFKLCMFSGTTELESHPRETPILAMWVCNFNKCLWSLIVVLTELCFHSLLHLGNSFFLWQTCPLTQRFSIYSLNRKTSQCRSIAPMEQMPWLSFWFLVLSGYFDLIMKANTLPLHHSLFLQNISEKYKRTYKWEVCRSFYCLK